MPGEGHLADRDCFPSVGGEASFQDRLIIGDCIEALKPRRGRRRKGAIGRLGSPARLAQAASVIMGRSGKAGKGRFAD